MAIGARSYALTMQNGGQQLLERRLEQQSATNIDGQTVGNTTIFTTSADLGRFVVVEFVLYTVLLDGTMGLATFSLGTNAATYDNISAAAQISANGTDKYEVRVPGDVEATGSTSVAASTAVVLRVDPAGTGTTATYACYVRGFYIG